MSSLLPPNSTALERALEQAMAGISAVPTPIETTWRPDQLRADLLPYLAYGLSVDAWPAEWPESIKRERTRRAIEIQRKKGTAESVRTVVASLGGSLALREWWQKTPMGNPHSFEMVLSIAQLNGEAPSAQYIETIIEEVRRTKPVRSYFTFTLALAATGSIGMIAAGRPVIHARLNCTAPAA